jgi:hypothetical protein
LNGRGHVNRRFLGAGVFAIAMAFLEASVVVYLRQLYYPGGFAFPLVRIPERMILIECGRELATIVMLISVSLWLGNTRWSRFGWFAFVFGVWDLFYYAWLRLLLKWPATLLDRDILFLVPLPWIGPVVAPIAIALTMCVIGVALVVIERHGPVYRPGVAAWALGVLGTALLLYAFMYDVNAGLRLQPALPFPYGLLAAGLACFWAGFRLSLRRLRSETNHH